MGARLYVGNLPYTVTSKDLRELFEQAAGQVVEATVMTKRDTGRSRGFGFVEMVTEAEARNVQLMFDGCTMGGRKLRVNPANEDPNKLHCSCGMSRLF
ncbi:RNA-binding protein [Candidatus Parcubacteria bacterium]|nr:MAG: RNA-binding protein [Candidatus Parcubacteria bacterium]